MKPYEVEIFDRQLNCVYHTLIDDISIKYDALSPVSNAIILPTDFKPGELSNEGNAPMGWYIRIFRSAEWDFSAGFDPTSEEHVGVISGIDKAENGVSVEFKQIETIFDANVWNNASWFYGKTIEQVIKKELETFTTASPDDPASIISGLSSSDITTLTSTTGRFELLDSAEDNGELIYNVLDDIILFAANTYNIFTEVTVNFADKHITVKIGKNTDTAQNVETSLPNIIQNNVNIVSNENRVNTAWYGDLDLHREYRYFLHPDMTYDTSTSDRIAPVIREVKYFSSLSEAESAVNAYFQERKDAITDKYNDLLLKLDRLYAGTFSQYYSAATFATFESYLHDLDVLHSGTGYQTWVFMVIPSDMSDNSSWQVKDPDSGDYYSITDSYWETNYNHQDTITIYAPRIRAALDSPTHRYRYDAKILIKWGNHDELDPGFTYQYEIYKNPSTQIPGNYLTYSNYEVGNIDFYPNSDQSYCPILARGYVDIKNTNNPDQSYHELFIGAMDKTWFTNAINAKKTAEMNTEEAWEAANKASLIQQYQADASTDTAAELAKNALGNAEYNHLIELSMLQNMEPVGIDPVNIKIGQMVNIYHEGISYSSILTGKEIGGGIIKLIFGIVRIELTKILKKKGV